MPLTVDVNTPGLDNLRKNWRQQYVSSPSIRIAYSKAGTTIQNYLRRRYITLSSGGGSWEPLKPATIQRKGSSRILRDTDELLNSLDFDIKNGRIVAGILSTGIHGKSGLRIRRLADIHNRGLGVNPRRVIVVMPPRNVINKVTEIIAQGYVNAYRTGT